jgi:hypothetical protein
MVAYKKAIRWSDCLFDRAKRIGDVFRLGSEQRRPVDQA